MPGTRYETPYYIKDSGTNGPTIVVIGGLHGDEPAGYKAAHTIAKWQITKGRLVVMPEAHKEAIRRKTRAYPGNMNNMFPGKANGDSMERLAHEIWQVIKNAQPDLLLTLHESRDFHARDPKRYGQTFCFDFPELEPAMKRVAAKANLSIEPELHKFLMFVAPFPHCPTYNAWAKLKVPATSIETSRTLPLATRERYQLVAVRAFFEQYGLEYQEQKTPMTASRGSTPLPTGQSTLPAHTGATAESEPFRAEWYHVLLGVVGAFLLRMRFRSTLRKLPWH